jgi:hypothetical protein
MLLDRSNAVGILETRNCLKTFFAKSEGRRKVGRTRRKYEDNIETDLQLLVCNGKDWMQVAFFFEHGNVQTVLFPGMQLRVVR